MFKVFKLILNINVERKACSHHNRIVCETKRKSIRYDVNMALLKGKVHEYIKQGLLLWEKNFCVKECLQEFARIYYMN